jgi:hypothetical protein
MSRPGTDLIFVAQATRLCSTGETPVPQVLEQGR